MTARDTPDPGLTIVGPRERFPKVTLTQPDTRGYFLCALTIDRRPPFQYWLQSPAKRRAMARLKALAANLEARPDVDEANVFRALLRPPGRGEWARKNDIPPADHDLVLLAAFESPAAARAFQATAEWQAIEAELSALASDRLVQTFTNTRRIGPVGHDRQGIFLFNYFTAADLDQNLAVWEYTAGWFQDQTGLDNSTVLLPDTAEAGGPTIVNHCRWDSARDILPSLIFKPSFRSFVLANFAANRTAAQPVLYRLA